MHSFAVIIGSLAVGAALCACPSCATKPSARTPAAEATLSTESVILIEGMTCASCSVAVRTALKKLDGVKDAKVSVADKRAFVEYEPGKVTPQQMVEAINKLGYRATLPPGQKGS